MHRTSTVHVWNAEKGGVVSTCSCGWESVMPSLTRARASARMHFRQANAKGAK